MRRECLARNLPGLATNFEPSVDATSPVVCFGNHEVQNTGNVRSSPSASKTVKSITSCAGMNCRTTIDADQEHIANAMVHLGLERNCCPVKKHNIDLTITFEVKHRHSSEPPTGVFLISTFWSTVPLGLSIKEIRHSCSWATRIYTSGWQSESASCMKRTSSLHHVSAAALKNSSLTWNRLCCGLWELFRLQLDSSSVVLTSQSIYTV